MFAIVAVAVRLNGAPVLSELAFNTVSAAMFAMLLYVRRDGVRDVQRRIGNSFLTTILCQEN